mgnify:FL=1
MSQVKIGESLTKEISSKKKNINGRNKDINKDLIISGNFIFNENDEIINKEEKIHNNYQIKMCEDENDIRENTGIDNNNIINTFINFDVNKSSKNYPHSSTNLNKLKKEGKYIFYEYNLIIDKNNIIIGGSIKTKSKRENKKDYE